MTQISFPWDKPRKQDAEAVNNFIQHFKPRLKKNQVELLEHFKDKIYGFHLQAHNQVEHSMNPYNNNEAIFVFEHEGVKGEITVTF